MQKVFVTGPPQIALTIAGHDPSNGAGITADLQVFATHGLFGTSCITALTVQSTRGVTAVHPVPADAFRHTLDHLYIDLPPRGIKIGMLATAPLVDETAAFLQKIAKIPIVLDPVILSSSGAPLLDEPGLHRLRTYLLPHVTWLTPNWRELALLTGLEVRTESEVESALDHLGKLHPHLYIVATGGDQNTPTDHLRTPDGTMSRIPGTHIDSKSTHGTGCAFSSALLSRIVLGDAPLVGVRYAKSFVENAIRTAPKVGDGRGPLNLTYRR